ncbi:MAG: dihydroorotate dehydrogenase [candidate division Zixibacteria bacterium]|nr:dihydroorotate dehydrogenase [candidate division Zixibacteria bacterium]
MTAPPDLTVHIGALALRNPVLAASGTFGYGSEYGRFVDLSDFGGIVTKTLTPEPWPGNPPPRAAETAAGMLNSIGLQNVGVEAFIRDKMPYLRKVDTALIVNVGGGPVEEFVYVTERLSDCEGIDALEINMSCPNVSGGMDFSTDPRRAAELVSTLRGITELPLIAKLTPNVTDIAEIARSVEEAGADAISAINTLRGMAVDIRTRRPMLGAVTGGLSGPAIKPVALAAVYRIARQVAVPVIGIGGIMSGEDAVEFLVAGATAVQVGTATFVEPRAGPSVARKLAEWCVASEVRSVCSLIGSIQIPSPEDAPCHSS